MSDWRFSDLCNEYKQRTTDTTKLKAATINSMPAKFRKLVNPKQTPSRPQIFANPIHTKAKIFFVCIN